MQQSGDDATLGPEGAPDTGSAREAPLGELRPGTVVGRYVVMSVVGAGGMGVVYSAHDPELDRRIALKVLAPAKEGSTNASAGRARLLREAQALAKLSHPNVVAVHDAGALGDAVWIAMEFVDGQTLRTWLDGSPRHWREVLPVMIAAGKGVAAAHQAGLLHRDFKPDNVMLSEDGRVRVMDFGLARRQAIADRKDDRDATTTIEESDPGGSGADALGLVLTRQGSIMGTPSYMSPEQFAGEGIGTGSDQFSFCVTLWEALHGERPFAGRSYVELATAVVEGKIRNAPKGKSPAWLRRICTRGLSVAPEARFPGMAELVSALEEGRSAARRRGALLGLAGVLACAAGVWGYGAYDLAARTGACAAEGERFAEVWDEDARSAVETSLSSVNVSYAKSTTKGVLPLLDAQAASIREHAEDACMRGVEGEWTEEQVAKATWCIEDQSIQLAALTTAFRDADETLLRAAVASVSRLQPVEGCVDPEYLPSLPDPPRDELRDDVDAVRETLAHTYALRAAGREREAHEQARAARERAEAIDWDPLSAAARRAEAASVADTGAHAEAEALYVEAYRQSAESSQWHDAAVAAVELSFLVGADQARPAEGRQWSLHAEIALSLAHDPGAALEGSRLSALGGVEFYVGNFAAAKALWERAIEIIESAEGPLHPNLARLHANVGLACQDLHDMPAAKHHFERAIEISSAALGPEHPSVAINLGNLASYHRETGDLESAISTYERAIEIMRAALGPRHPSVASAMHNLANAYSDAERPDEARPLLELALEIWIETHGEEHRDVITAMGNLALAHESLGQFERAADLQARAIELSEKVLGGEHPKVASLLSDLAQTRTGQARFGEAVGLLERALAIYDANEGEQSGESQCHFNLARALVADGRDRARAISEAEKAATGFAALPEKAEDLADVREWLESTR